MDARDFLVKNSAFDIGFASAFDGSAFCNLPDGGIEVFSFSLKLIATFESQGIPKNFQFDQT